MPSAPKTIMTTVPKGVMTPDREAVFDEAMANLESPQKLRKLADAFRAEDLIEQADKLRRQAASREADRVVRGPKKRELGTITQWSKRTESGKIPLFFIEIDIEFEGTRTQSFHAQFTSEADINGFVDDLCNVLGKSNIKELEGTKAFALRSWNNPKDSIEGLESTTPPEKRITKTGWMRRNDPLTEHPSPFDAKARAVAAEIAALRTKLEEREAHLRALEAGFTDWEQMP